MFIAIVQLYNFPFFVCFFSPLRQTMEFSSHYGASTNYVDQILPFLEHLPIYPGLAIVKEFLYF